MCYRFYEDSPHLLVCYDTAHTYLKHIRIDVHSMILYSSKSHATRFHDGREHPMGPVLLIKLGARACILSG